MEENSSLDSQVKTLRRQVGGIARLVKDLKCSMESLEKKVSVKENTEIQEIIDAQQLLDEIIVANSDAIKRIEKEIKEIAVNKSSKAAPEEIIEADDNVKKGNKRRKCRYYNRGYCKHTIKCRYLHPENICKVNSETQSCKEKQCMDRHPKLCKWLKQSGGCKRQNCAYLHCDKTNKESERNNVKVAQTYKCESCKYTWKSKDCVVKHVIENMEIYFCLNCEDWVQHKQNVLKEGWSLFDGAGFLRTDI